MKKSTCRKPMLAPHPSVGVDLGSRIATACLLDRRGRIVAMLTVGMTPAEVRTAFEQLGKERLTILLGACGPSGWVARVLEELGHDVLVCNPRNLKLIACSTLKTDKLDAEILARLARLAQMDPELVRRINPRSRQAQVERNNLVVRDQLVTSRTRMITVVRNILCNDALATPHCDADRFALKVRLIAMPDDIREVITPIVDAIQRITEQVAIIEAKIERLAAGKPEAKRFRTIPGVGLLTAVAYTTTIEDPARFERSRDVGPYLGITPVVRQSSDVERRGACTKQGDKRLRRCLVQAAFGLLRSQQDCELKQWALKVAERRGKKKAIVALARKIAVVMHHLWVTGEDFVPFPNRQEVNAAA